MSKTTYEVDYYKEVWGVATVEAESREEAEAITLEGNFEKYRIKNVEMEVFENE